MSRSFCFQKIAKRLRSKPKSTPLQGGSIRGYIDANKIISAAAKAGMSVGDFVESMWGEEGRTSTIIERLSLYLDYHPRNVLEIGAGTGRYVQEFLTRYSVERVHIFEPDKIWAEYLSDSLGKIAICHPTDGFSLDGVADSSIDLVAAHGVFVYLPYATTWSYLREIERVLVEGGTVWFDVYADIVAESVQSWYEAQSMWPIVYSKALIQQMVEAGGSLVIKDTFSFQHGKTVATYIIATKTQNNFSS